MDEPLTAAEVAALPETVKPLYRAGYPAEADTLARLLVTLAAAQAQVAALEAEVERLGFLHKNDHALADRHQEHRERAEAEVAALTATLNKLTRHGKLDCCACEATWPDDPGDWRILAACTDACYREWAEHCVGLEATPDAD